MSFVHALQLSVKRPWYQTTLLFNPLVHWNRTFGSIQRRFIPSHLDGVEDIEFYQPGGYHPISIGDTFDQGRFRILHKLGFGGSSTVWLARDQWAGKEQGQLVTLKAIASYVTSESNPNEIPELVISQKLRTALPESVGLNYQTVDHHFFVEGPNGSHLFLVFPFAGPNLLSMFDAPGRTIGSRRLRADLARRFAKQVAIATYDLHRTGIVHGDLTTSNILINLSPHVTRWSDTEVYAHLGHPETEEVRTCDGNPPGPEAPANVVEPIPNSEISAASLLQESVILSDFGQSYLHASPSPSYNPGTVLNYTPPEMRFEGRTGIEADIWTLGCAIFEMRAGFPLFESIMGSDIHILQQTVETLGRLPDPWWHSFDERAQWFEEDGQPKSEEDQERAGVNKYSKAYKCSIKKKLEGIGRKDDPPFEYEGSMIEMSGTLVPEREIELLEDLLEKMLKYKPEERISMKDVIQHPWFML